MRYDAFFKQVLISGTFVALLVAFAFSQETDLKDRFESEYRAWKKSVEEKPFSSAPQYNEHMTQIVNMGVSVLPLIIEKMEKKEFKMDFLLESAVYSISRKDFEKEDWPEGRRGGSHAAAAMYIDWWHSGIKETEESFNGYYRKWKEDLAGKKQEMAQEKLWSIQKLGIAAIPFMIEKIKEGDLEFISIISDHTNGSLSETASKDECVDWWNENKDKYTIVQDE